MSHAIDRLLSFCEWKTILKILVLPVRGLNPCLQRCRPAFYHYTTQLPLIKIQNMQSLKAKSSELSLPICQCIASVNCLHQLLLSQACLQCCNCQARDANCSIQRHVWVNAWDNLLLRCFKMFMMSMKLVIPLHSLYWSIHIKDESKRVSAFAFIFGVNWPVQWM